MDALSLCDVAFTAQSERRNDPTKLDHTVDAVFAADEIVMSDAIVGVPTARPAVVNKATLIAS